MIFLIFGIIDLIATIVMLIFTCIAPNPTSFIALIALVLNCILFFSLYGMRKDVNRNEENISILQDSLNECRKKLGLKPLERESEYEQEEEFEQDEPDEDNVEEEPYDELEEDIYEDDRNIPEENECPACFHKVSPDDTECPNCGHELK